MSFTLWPMHDLLLPGRITFSINDKVIVCVVGWLIRG
tara:strand:- start:4043 stop:4153 length:111 start_codon:yes stop_codon:yes gene_type:complete